MRIYECQRCLEHYAKPYAVCSKCLGLDLSEVDVSDEGKLVSWTTIRRAPAGFAVSAPYDVVAVDLAGGLRVTGRLAAQSAAPSMFARVLRTETEDQCPIFNVIED